MRMSHISAVLLSAGLLLSASLSGCASMTDTSATAGVEIPADAVESTRTESNGDIVSEYRVGGRLAVRRRPLRRESGCSRLRAACDSAGARLKGSSGRVAAGVR